MIQISISRTHTKEVAGAVLGGEVERCAVLYASRALSESGGLRLIVKEVEVPEPDSYSQQSKFASELNPAFVAKISKRAKLRGESIVFVHSHPGDEPPQFSRVDNMGERRLAEFLTTRTPDIPHGAIVISAGGWRARKLGTSTPVKVVSIGEQRQVLFDPDEYDDSITAALFDRQVRAFGEAGQRVIGSLTVAIVGLGGTGSVAAEQLAHLGVRRFILIDPDAIEQTNLNRVVGTCHADIDRPKVDVAAEHISSIAPDAEITRIQGDVTRTRTARALLPADFIFSCTDSHGSRAVIQQVAYQYLIPCIDVGSVLTATAGRVTGIHGRVQALAPDLPCFTCSGLIDAEQVRRDMMDDEERRLDPYIQGAHEPAPAVISINATITSLAVTMFMAITVGVPSDGRYILYNAKGPTLRSVRATQNPACYICSPLGVLARGDSQSLFTRDE